MGGPSQPELPRTPTCSPVSPGQGVLQQRFQYLRHVHGRTHPNPLTARHGTPRGEQERAALEKQPSQPEPQGDRERERGAGKAANKPQKLLSPRLPTPAPAWAAWRAWAPCQQQHVELAMANPTTENRACYLTLQKEVWLLTGQRAWKQPSHIDTQTHRYIPTST